MKHRVSSPIATTNGINASVPMRETITVQSYGRLHDVYKDDWMKEFNRAAGIGIRMQGTRSCFGYHS